MQEGDTTSVMQKYFMVFLKSGSERSQSKEESMEIQEQHMAYLQKMTDEGKTSITGPMAGEGDIRGIVVYNTATAEEARRLAEEDPAVNSGTLGCRSASVVGGKRVNIEIKLQTKSYRRCVNIH